VNPTVAAIPAWDAADDTVADGTAEYQRALCYLAGKEKGNAIQWLQAAWTKNPK
jgi:hypothetical protein